MVAINARLNDLEELVGRKLPHNEDQLNELLYQIKCELSHPNTDKPPGTQSQTLQADAELHIENVDTNRADTWSSEGIARALRGMMGIEVGLRKYSVSKRIATEIFVDEELKEIRPFIACVVAQHPKLSDEIIRGLIQLQEKLDQSYGRKRKRSSIGFYDFDLITPPLRYGIEEPDKIRFVPLEGTEQLSLREILERHPKGLEYGHIVSHHPRLPILLDSTGKVLSFPPIINSNDLGKITEETRNILVEITGTSEDTVANALTILTTALADRGAEISPARVHYAYGKARTVLTPSLQDRRFTIATEEIRTMMGLDLSPKQITTLLKRARYNGIVSAERAAVTVPSYRIDVLHSVDIIEDIAIAYGLNNMKPKWPSDLTIGGMSPMEEFSDNIRELLIGLGFQEILTYMMTNGDTVFTRMNLGIDGIVEIANPKVLTMTSLRHWLLPSIMEFLSKNTHVEYPQKLFEVGDCAVWDAAEPNKVKDVRKLACVSVHSRANFTEIKSILEPLMLNVGFEFMLEPMSHSSFIPGRVGRVLVRDKEVGIIGELHPQVLENWNLEDPVAALELNLNKLFRIHENLAGGAPEPPTSERAN